MGRLHVKFHEDRCKGEAFMRLKPFYLTARLQTDGRTDRQTDRVIPVYPTPNFVAGGIKMLLEMWWRTGLWNAAPWLKIHANFPTPCHQNHKDPPEVHDHDRNNHWKGYQSIQWRPWNQAVFRWTKNRSARRKNHRISQGDGQKPHPTIIDRAESRRPESQRWRCVSDQINQRLVCP